MGIEKTDGSSIKDSRNKKRSSETNLEQMAEHVEPNTPAASPALTGKILPIMETPQGVGI